MRTSKNRVVLGVVLAGLVFGATHNIRAELPQAIGTWASLGATPESRIGAAAVALKDGRTVIAGGSVDGVATDSVVAFDPNTGSFSIVGHLLLARVGHTATLLDDGRILIAGGTAGDLISADLELFDPVAGVSALGGAMAQPRTGHAAAKLANGKVLIVGGTSVDGVLQNAEVYDPETGATTATVLPMLSPRTGASATTLIDGRVLVAGGNNGTADLASAEIFEPSSQIFEAATTSLSFARSRHVAVLLPNNNSVLIAGGSSNGVPVPTSDLFLPAEFPDPYSYGMGSFAQTSDLLAARSRAIASPHIEGYAVAMGGGAPEAEVYRFPTIKTDKDDYAPGELAVITGSGWQPGEAVKLVFQEDPAVHDDYVIDRDSSDNPVIVADGNGDIYYNQWAPEQHDLNVRFYLMAKQATLQGERRAQTTFTDANPAPTVTIVNVSDALLNASDTSTDVTWKADQVGTYEVRIGGNNCGQGTPVASGNYSTANANVANNILATSLSEGANTIRVCVTNIPSPPKTGDNTTSVTKDSGAPNTSITAQPADPSNSTSASFSFTGTDPAPSSGSLVFECDLDGGGFAACTSPKAYAGLSTGNRTFQVRAKDAAGNIDASPASFTWTIDTTAPTINNVTGPGNGSYGAGQNLDFTVNYNENVTVTGTPIIGLTIGATGRNASYVSGSGSSALLFRYVVQAGETDSDGITSASPIALNGGTIRDAATHNAGLTFTPPITTGVLVDTTAPTASISYSPTGPVKAGVSLTITATFSEPMADSPVVRFAISGANTMPATNMTKTDSTHYTGTHVVGAGNGLAAVMLSVGTDVAGNVIIPVPTSGATFTVDNTAPTAAITYSTTTPVNAGTSLTITATFIEPMADAPVVKIAITGANTLAATDMSKTDSTHYTYVHAVGAGNGTATVALSVGTDVAGNVITSAPTIGATFTVDNTPPGTPTVPDLASGSDSGILNTDDTTNVTSNLKFSGMAEGNSTIKLFIDGSGTPVGTDTANGGGNWNNVNVAGPVSEGTHTIRATATDAAGNESGPSAALTFTIDTIGPTVTINQAVGQADPANVPPINFTAVFNESVSGFTTGDLTFAGSTAPGVLVGTVTGTGPYDVAVTGMTAAGTVVANIAAGVATDAAGNNNTAATFTDHTVTYNPDSTAPIVTVSFGAPDGDNNWFKHSPVLGTVSANDTTTGNSNVTAITCLDGVTPLPVGSPSGIGTPSASGTVSVSGEGTHNISCTVSDSAGNTGGSAGSTAMPVVVKIDTVKPTATATPSRLTPDHNGWYNNALTIHFAGSDASSMIASCTVDNVYGGPDTASASVQGTCTDNAGNVSDPAVFDFKFDASAPTVDATPDRPADHNGWYNHALTIDFSATDAVSGVESCDADHVYSGPDTMTASVSGECTNGAGLMGSGHYDFRYDATQPYNVSGGPNRSPDHNGWYNHAVDVAFHGTDDTSGIDACSVVPYSGPDTLSASVNGNCTDVAGNTSSPDAASSTFKYDATPPSAALAVTAGTLGTNGWYTSDMTVGTSGTDTISNPTTCTADQFQTTETPDTTFSGDCTNDAGLTGHAAPLTVKLDKTAPTGVVLAVISGTLGLNGWYTSNVTVGTSGTETIGNPIMCTADQFQTTDTTGQLFHGSCTNDAGLSANADGLTIKRDATAPTLTLLFTPDVPDGNAGWWKTPGGVPFNWTCTDATSMIDATYYGGCPAPASGTVTVNGTTSFDDQVRDQAGNLSAHVMRELKLDNVAPVVNWNTAGDNCSLPGNAGWCRATQTAAFTASDVTSGLSNPAQTAFTQSTGTNGGAVTIPSGSVGDVAGNINTGINAGPYKIDSVAPNISLTAPANSANYALNAAVASIYSCSDPAPSSGIATCAGPVDNGANFSTNPVAGHSFTVNASDVAGNPAAATNNYSVLYSTGLCLGEAGHQILQPINADNSSVFKQKSTVPGKFRVCDAGGNSVGTPGVVADFRLIQIISGTVDAVDEAVDSTTPDTAFRWSATDKLWIFNITTKSLQAGKTYVYKITLNDNSTIQFQFGLK